VLTAAPQRLWIVSPVFFDVEPYLRLRAELQAILGESAAAHFVVVDDSGGGDPGMQALASCSDVRVLTPPFNLGHQRAIVFGLRSLAAEIAADDLVVTIDADGEDRPADLPRLLATLRADGAAPRRIVLARRTSRQVSLAFRVLYAFFVVLFRFLTGTVMRTGNYAAYSGWVVKNILFHPHFDLCYSASLVSLNLDVRYVPCPRAPRYAGRSHMSYFKLVRHGTAMLMPFLDRIAVRALLGFSAIFGSGMALAMLAAVLLLFTSIPVPAWTATALLATLVLSFFALGNFVLLFAIYAQSQGAAMSGLEGRWGSRARSRWAR
jgi:hypothetical protein